ncbi:hypothetical protein PRNP1_004337 [Phytophthora ramorum]
MALTMNQVVVVSIGSAAVYTALNILVADLWVFPIPFLVVTGAPLMFSIWAIVSRLVLGPHPLAGVQDGEFLGRRFLMLTAVHGSLLGIYPAYQAIFLEVDGLLELAMIALLPAVNLSLRNLQTALGSHLEDNLPEVIIFSIDVFNAIYSVLCMHSANSIKMVAITLASTTSSEAPMLQKPSLSAPRLFHLIQARPSRPIVEPVVSPPRLSRLAVSALWQETSDKLIPIISRSNPVIGNILEETRKQNTRAVKQTLQLLFNNEYLGLSAYTQCIIPAIYLMYMPVLQALPNHVYYPTHYRYFGEANEFEERMTVIGVLFLLQLLVFIGLQVFVVKRFGVSTIYQVAFVLENHFLLLQGKLLMWLIFAVQSTLEHYGVDFSFQFAWVHKGKA